MAAREFDRGRGSLEVKQGEVEMGLSHLRGEFEGSPQFRLGAGEPALLANGYGEEIVSPRVFGIEQHRLAERREGGICLVGVAIKHAEREPGGLGIGVDPDRLLQRFFRRLVFLEAVLDNPEVYEAGGMIRGKGEQLLKRGLR